MLKRNESRSNVKGTMFRVDFISFLFTFRVMGKHVLYVWLKILINSKSEN